jgi:hypothetical protein
MRHCEAQFQLSLRDEQMFFVISDPAMNRWAIVRRPYGSSTGCDAWFQSSLRDEQTFFVGSDPAMNRWAIVKRPYGSEPSEFVCNNQGVFLGWENRRAFSPLRAQFGH